MKKLLLVATTILVAFAFTSCDPVVEKTRKELLIQKKGWELYSATSVPAFTNKDGVVNSNLFESFFYDYEKDDILFFYENGSSIMNYGKILESGTTEKEISLGNWRLIKDDKVLEFHLPYFFNDDDTFYQLEADISVLDESTMTLIMKVKYDNGVPPTKSPINTIRNDRGMKGIRSVTDYTFTFTYKVAK